ncbi:hypothetical protein LP421_04920 (plasmid) [Rhizobium sp. RCAM05350]|nr:hypothetical protein LP421_04920 [Rhizobium sp. RCAM05350]
MIEFARLFWTTHALHETAIATARCMGIPQLECEAGGAYSAESAVTFARSKAAGWLIVSIRQRSFSIEIPAATGLRAFQWSGSTIGSQPWCQIC